MVSAEPAKKAPITTHQMWMMVVEDLATEEARLSVTRQMSDVPNEAIAHGERRLRLRQAICNAVDFLITNKEDIDRVIAMRRGKNS